MRIFLSGLVAAAVATALWLTLEHLADASLGWIACLVGLVTGVAIYRASDKQERHGLVRGALAIVVTLAAIVGGRQLYLAFVRANALAVNPVALGEASPVERETVDEPDDASDDAAPPAAQPANIPRTDPGAIGDVTPSLNKSLSELDMLWMTLAALGAYVTGKGRGSAVREGSEEGDKEPAAKDAGAAEGVDAQ